MAYHLGQVPEPPAAETPTFAMLYERQVELAKQFKESEDRRRLAMYIGMAGAVFAAFRLGVLAVPSIRQRAWRGNPRRRR